MIEVTTQDLLAVLEHHIGRERGVSCRDLGLELAGYSNPASERHLRKLIEQLRLEGQPICGHPSSGYFVAATADELNDCCRFLVKRITTTTRQIAAMKKMAAPDLYGQFRITQ